MIHISFPGLCQKVKTKTDGTEWNSDTLCIIYHEIKTIASTLNSLILLFIKIPEIQLKSIPIVPLIPYIHPSIVFKHRKKLETTKMH